MPAGNAYLYMNIILANIKYVHTRTYIKAIWDYGGCFMRSRSVWLRVCACASVTMIDSALPPMTAFNNIVELYIFASKFSTRCSE